MLLLTSGGEEGKRRFRTKIHLMIPGEDVSRPTNALCYVYWCLSVSLLPFVCRISYSDRISGSAAKGEVITCVCELIENPGSSLSSRSGDAILMTPMMMAIMMAINAV